MFFGRDFYQLIFLIYIYKTLPDIDQISNHKNIVTVRYSNGDIIKKYGEYETITYNQIPQHLVNALVATEDNNFFNHKGFDGKAMIRAFLLIYFLEELFREVAPSLNS